MKKTIESEFGKPEEFKNIVQLASHICETRSALINYLDEEYQWTLFNVGWENKKIPKEQSICQFTVNEEGLVYIPDTNKDARLQQVNAVNNDSNIGFYAGVGFRGNNNSVNGTLCVIDDKPKELSEVQKNALKNLASEVESKLELIRSKQKVHKQNERLKKTARFLKNSTDVMMTVDPKTLVIQEIHAEDDEKLGYTSKELEGSVLSEYCTDSLFVEKLKKWTLKQQPETMSLETKFIQKSGNTISLHLNVSIADGLLYLTGRDITEHNAAEKQLKKEKFLSDGIIENLPGIFCLVNEDGKVKRWNKNLESVTGYGYSGIENASVEKFLDYDSLQMAFQKLEDIFEHHSARTEVMVVTKKGEKIPFLLTGFHYEIDEEAYAVVIGVNISDEKQALKQLQQKEEKLKTALNRLENAQHIARLGSWEWNIKNGSLYWSDETYEILQMNMNEEKASIHLLFDLMDSADKRKMLDAINNILNGGTMHDFEHDIFLPDGTIKHVLERGEVIASKAGKPVKVMGTIQDITEQKKAEEKLKEMLNEKEVMLAEIHHRVKNNLAVVSGLLQLEADFTEERGSFNSLLKSVTRIKSMAAIHEKLYTTGNFLNVSFGSYISDLVTVIENLYQDKDSEQNINIVVSSDEIDLNINLAIPCALILNELLTNSFKYAFPNRQDGLIEINLEKVGKKIRLQVKDDGVGIPESVDPEQSTSLGFTLLGLLCKQINAEYKISGIQGTTVEILFYEEQFVKGASGNMFRNGP